ncbi:peptide-methionine (S)-S-oxide reductase MsrA [Crocinitomicaceae bacterium]|nr:peptide-methionine (S)-S-oxide reductase MsrA [Crocinitomicaceae bacterium]
MKKVLFILVIGLSLGSCAQQSKNNHSSKTTSHDLDGLQVAYFASGCFWCVEAVYESVVGVHEAVSGYSGGIKKNPTYEEVCTGTLKHAEAVKVYYDSSVVDFKTLVDVFFNSHNPSQKNAQGPDHGPQYRSIVFYSTAAEKAIITRKIKALQQARTWSQITTEVIPFDVFYPAEDYHQNYERLHPNHPYVRRVSIPRLNQFKEKMPEVLKR